MTDPTTRIRERIATIIFEETGNAHLVEAAADAILREFALRPVAQGVVDSESGEVK
jgi:hypothetical protein